MMRILRSLSSVMTASRFHPFVGSFCLLLRRPPSGSNIGARLLRRQCVGGKEPLWQNR